MYFEFIYALLPRCTFCHRCSLWLLCGATSFGGHSSSSSSYVYCQ